MAVLSNKPDDLTKLCVGQLLPNWRFTAVLGATPSLPRKPDPAGAQGSGAPDWALLRARSSTWAIPIPTCRRPSGRDVPGGCAVGLPHHR